jgi:hypothetical protein
LITRSFGLSRRRLLFLRTGEECQGSKEKEVMEFHKVVHDWMAIPLISKLPAQYG